MQGAIGGPRRDRAVRRRRHPGCVIAWCSRHSPIKTAARRGRQRLPRRPICGLSSPAWSGRIRPRVTPISAPANHEVEPMTLRLVSAAILAAATLIASTGLLTAQSYTNQNDPEGRFSGGSPRGKIYSAFGGYAELLAGPEDHRQLRRQLQPRHDRHQHHRAPPLSRARRRPGDPLRHRRRPRRLHLGGHDRGVGQEGMAGLDAARRRCWRAAPTCRAT